LYAELAEARTGRFLRDHQFQILEWEPASATGFPGDLLVQLGESASIFVEVKAPDWQGELTSEERLGVRKQHGKFLHAEARAVGLCEMPLRVIEENALKKFTHDRPNLAVVVDDLFSSPAEARGVIEWQIDQFFRKPEVQCLGGILFLLVECPAGRGVRYISNFYDNRAATSACMIPDVAIKVLRECTERDANIVNQEWG
jgi:hypothetical protein